MTIDNNYARAGAKVVQTQHAQVVVTAEEPLEFNDKGAVTAAPAA